MANVSSTEKRPTQFNLVRWFALFGTLAILLTTVMTSVVLSRFLESHLLDRDAAVLRDFVARIAMHHNPAGYFTNGYTPSGSPLNDFFQDIAHMPDVARINAYALDHSVVYSSDSSMINQKFDDNDELEEALGGRLVYEKGDIKELSKAEHVRFSREISWFVENYIPIRGTDSDAIVGVVEIYRVPVALSKSIRTGRLLVWGCVFGGGLLTLMGLFSVINRAQKLIDSQQDKLMEQTRLATIGEMASSVAHSIRNPIASIRSSAELALDGSADPEINESLGDIIGEVDRFDGWIRELLTYANVRGDLRATARLNDVVSRSVHDVTPRARHRSVDILNLVGASLPQTRGDTALLTQVVNSLIANALDAMPQGGLLTLSSVVGRSSVQLSISDTGFGIPDDRLSRLFDPLTTHKQGGLGIGLTLARQILHRYGGEIAISSSVGTGTTVMIELPRAGGAL